MYLRASCAVSTVSCLRDTMDQSLFAASFCLPGLGEKVSDAHQRPLLLLLLLLLLLFLVLRSH